MGLFDWFVGIDLEELEDFDVLVFEFLLGLEFGFHVGYHFLIIINTALHHLYNVLFFG
jgi:hypothetical protein